MIYLLVDDLAGRARLAELQAALGDPSTAPLNTTRFEGARVELGELAAACEAMPFLADRRLVVVRGQLGKAEGGGRGVRGASTDQPLADYLERLPETTDLVFVESELPSSGAAFKAIQALAVKKRAAIVRDAPMDQGAAVEWVRKRAQERGGQIAPDAATALVAGVGTDARALETELEKLLLFADGRPIGMEELRDLVPAGDDLDVWKLVEAIGNRDARGAVRAWRARLRAGEDPHRMLPMVSRQVRLLAIAADHLQKGIKGGALQQALGMPQWQADRLGRQAGRWRPAVLREVMAQLAFLDREEKTGGEKLGAALELLIAELAAGREPTAADRRVVPTGR